MSEQRADGTLLLIDTLRALDSTIGLVRGVISAANPPEERLALVATVLAGVAQAADNLRTRVALELLGVGWPVEAVAEAAHVTSIDELRRLAEPVPDDPGDLAG